jgi:hypothetical protein
MTVHGAGPAFDGIRPRDSTLRRWMCSDWMPVTRF